jgi:hypothetical protein
MVHLQALLRYFFITTIPFTQGPQGGSEIYISKLTQDRFAGRESIPQTFPIYSKGERT